jgi:uncharacterized C2H2 Zn-finger protein
MVDQVQRDGTDWYACEECGLMFDDPDDARTHEDGCTGEQPDYLQ